MREIGNNPTDKNLIYVFNIKVEPSAQPQNRRRDGHAFSAGAKEREPLTELIERKESIIITAELPGQDAKMIRLMVDAERATIESQVNGVPSIRSLELTSMVDPRRSMAFYNNGVLEVELFKSKSYGGKMMRINIM